jgi:transcriptional regulator with XRE-family HTH domain
MDPPDPIEAIKFRMEQQGLTRKDLAGLLGSRTRVAEVLNRRRGLSINMIRRLYEKPGNIGRGIDSSHSDEKGRLKVGESFVFADLLLYNDTAYRRATLTSTDRIYPQSTSTRTEPSSTLTGYVLRGSLAGKDSTSPVQIQNLAE